MGIRIARCLVFLTMILLIASCATMENKANHLDFMHSPMEGGDWRPDQAYINRIEQMTRTELEAEIVAICEELKKAIADKKKAQSVGESFYKQFDVAERSDISLYPEMLMANAEYRNEYIRVRILEEKYEALEIAYRKLLWIEKGYKRY